VRKVYKEILEYVFMFMFLVFVYGVGAYYDTRLYNECYGTTATTATTTENKR